MKKQEGKMHLPILTIDDLFSTQQERDDLKLEKVVNVPLSEIDDFLNHPFKIESINSSFRKVTKKGAFPNENALLKLLYLRVTELYKKWDNSTIYNWAMVRNELDAHPKFQDRFRKYCN